MNNGIGENWISQTTYNLCRQLCPYASTDKPEGHKCGYYSIDYLEDEAPARKHEIRQVRGREQVCHRHIHHYPDRDPSQQAHPETLPRCVKGESLQQGSNRNEHSASQ